MANVLHDATLWRRWLIQVLRRLGLHTNYRAFYHVWDQDFLVDVHCGRRTFRDAFRSFLLSAGLSCAQIEEVEAACEARRRQWDAAVRLLPGVKSTLWRLHSASLVLGVLTDSEKPSAAVENQLAQLGLGGLFRAVLSSTDLGRTKPDPVAYLTALRRMNLAPAETAFVGHSAAELAGAAEVGMMTVAFNFDPDVKAEAYLARFDQLLDIVGTGSRYAAAG
jgi:HAD superfamily hydrolase (TIGR01509 family)